MSDRRLARRDRDRDRRSPTAVDRDQGDRDRRSQAQLNGDRRSAIAINRDQTAISTINWCSLLVRCARCVACLSGTHCVWPACPVRTVCVACLSGAHGVCPACPVSTVCGLLVRYIRCDLLVRHAQCEACLSGMYSAAPCLSGRDPGSLQTALHCKSLLVR